MIAEPMRLLDSLRGLPHETEWLEFKGSFGDQDEIGKYISGLANAAILAGKLRAYLVFGIDNDTHNVTGTTVRLKEKLVGNEPFEHWLSRLLHPSISFEFVGFQSDGKRVELVAISPAYVSPVRFKNETYIRVGSVLKPIRDHPERERALWAATNRIAFERGVAATHLTVSDIFGRFEVQAYFDRLKSPRSSQTNQINQLLERGLIIDDDQSGFDVTNLFVLLCASNVGEFSHLARKTPRVIRYDKTSKIVGIDDEQGRIGFGVSFSRVLKFIMDRIDHKEEMRHGTRVNVSAIPEIAVRELVANALIHQDLTTSGEGPKIEIFDNRVVITNPGESLVDTSRLIDAPPRSRNEKLAGAMRELAHCEERGSGVDRAVDAVERSSCPPPLFVAVGGSTVATLYTQKSFAALTRDERVRACYQHASVRFEADAPMGNASLRARFGLSDRQYPQVSLVIKDTIDAGQIKPLSEDQGNRNARYVPHWA